MKVRDLAWTDFQGWVDLYYSRYDEIGRNPDLGIFLYETKPSLSDEATTFGRVMKDVLDGNQIGAVAEDGDHLIGSCMVGRVGHHLEDRHVGSLGIAIHPDWRGRGVGDALMGYVLARCPGVFEIVVLKVLSINEPASRLYRKHGFREYGRQPRSFKRGERYLDDVLMWRDIEPKVPPSP